MHITRTHDNNDGVHKRTETTANRGAHARVLRPASRVRRNPIALAPSVVPVLHIRVHHDNEMRESVDHATIDPMTFLRGAAFRASCARRHADEIDCSDLHIDLRADRTDWADQRNPCRRSISVRCRFSAVNTISSIRFITTVVQVYEGIFHRRYRKSGLTGFFAEMSYSWAARFRYCLH